MSKLQLSEAAEQDLIDIWRFIARDSDANADHFVDRLHRSFERYATQPEMATLVRLEAENLRYFSVGNYVVFYRSDDRAITILRVLHGARNISELLRSELP